MSQYRQDSTNTFGGANLVQSLNWLGRLQIVQIHFFLSYDVTVPPFKIKLCDER